MAEQLPPANFSPTNSKPPGWFVYMKLSLLRGEVRRQGKIIGTKGPDPNHPADPHHPADPVPTTQQTPPPSRPLLGR